MSLFEHLSIFVSIVLGLGVTLLLTSLIGVFRRRKRERVDWIPLAWAGYVLVLQVQYWWAVWKLAGAPDWTVLSFGVVLLQAIVMFVAAGLVLPSGSDEYPSNLGDDFGHNGKRGVAALGVRGGVAVTGNAVL